VPSGDRSEQNVPTCGMPTGANECQVPSVGSMITVLPVHVVGEQ